MKPCMSKVFKAYDIHIGNRIEKSKKLGLCTGLLPVSSGIHQPQVNGHELVINGTG